MNRRMALSAGLGGFLSLVVDRGLGDGGGDGLRATVVAAPLVLGLLAALAVRLGARPSSGVERLLAAGWLMLAFEAGSLGIAGLDTAVFVAGVLLLARRAAALVPALRRHVGRDGARAWGDFAALAFVVGFAVLPWVDARGEPFGDEPYFLLVAESWWSDGDVDLADEYRDGVAFSIVGRELAPQPGDPVGPAGELFSRHGSLLPLLLAPFWASGGVFGARLAMLALWSLLGGAILRLGFAFGLPAGAAFRAALVASLAPPLLLYAHSIWVEVPAALAAAIALELWCRERASGASTSAARRAGFVAALVALPLLKLRLLAVAVPLGALALVGGHDRRGRGRWALATLSALAITVLAVMARNAELVGNALRIYEPHDLALDQVPAGQAVIASWGLLFDSAFGLLAWSPIWLLALAGIARAAFRRAGYALALASFVPYFVLIVSRREWFGGWSPPFRYGLVVVPLLAIGWGELLLRPPTVAVRRIAVALGALTGLAAMAAWVEPGWVPSFADGRSRLVDLASAPFAADFARFLPSSVRPRLATWIVPLAAVVAAVLAARGRRRATSTVVPVGIAALLVACTLLVEKAHRVPTWTVEVEDPWVDHQGGALFPDRWTIDRTRFEGGWTLAPRRQIELRPVSGGDQLVVRVRVRTLRRKAAPAPLVLLVDGRPTRRWEVEAGATWQWLESEPLEWRPRRQLGLQMPGWQGRRSAVVVDRLELDWR